MKRFSGALVGLVCLASSTPALAQDAIQWSGEIRSTVGTNVLSCGGGDCPLTNYNNRNTFKLQLDAELTDNVVAVGAVSIRNINESAVTSADDSTQIQNVQPVYILIENAYVQGYDVVPGLDIRVGSQRIQWGTADGYRPSDRVNPMDLQDPIRFDLRLPSVAASFAYHIKDLTLNFSWIPFFTPSLLSTQLVEIVTSEEATNQIEFDLGADDPPEVRDLRTRIELPDASLANMQYAARAVWNAPIADFALGYFWGRDSLPALSGELIPETFFSRDEVDVLVNLDYPRIQMVTADARGPLFSEITGWVDFALVIPTATTIFISDERMDALVRLGVIDDYESPVDTTIQTGAAYPTFALGLDRSFGDIMYANLQYLYGFIFERNPGDLHHYAILNLRFPSQENFIELDTRGGIEANPGLDTFGWLASARVTTRFSDVFRFSLLGAFQNGQSGSTMRLFRPISEVRIEAGAKF